MIWISIAVFIGVASLVGFVAVFLRGEKDAKVEDRLDILAGLKKAPTEANESVIKDGAISGMKQGLSDAALSWFGNYRFFFEQADTSLTAAQFFAISGALSGGGAAAMWFVDDSMISIPIVAAIMGLLPLGWLWFRRKKRLKKFQAQLPDALELIARALRAGHSLGSGMNLVHDEMPAPVGVEFGRTFEEQNLGIPLEDSLRSLCNRVPNLDLKFFATAVILQRQTGGDLAEILDKIGYIIRERFRIWGQVQALTGEGRLSGIVLLALPPLLFLAVYRLNPKYASKLFEDPMGQQMLLFAVISQIIGALVIKKIVNIKV